MDANTALLVFSAIYGVYFFWRMQALSAHVDTSNWKLPAVVFFSVAGLALLVAPGVAGFVCTLLLVLLVIVPVQGFRLLSRLQYEQRFITLLRVHTVLRYLHPLPNWGVQQTLFQALAHEQRGELSEARQLLRTLKDDPASPVAVTAAAYYYRIDGQWEEALRWLEGYFYRKPAERSSPGGAYSLMRIYGELGDLNQMWGTLERSWGGLASTGNLPVALLVACAFSGRPDLVEKLSGSALAMFPSWGKALWRGVAHFAAGEATDARQWLDSSLAQAAPGYRPQIERRLTQPPVLAAPALSDASRSTLDKAETLLRQFEGLRRSQSRVAWVTYSLIAVNVGVFLYTFLQGAESNLRVLLDVGALAPLLVIRDAEWWRLLTSMFLHGSLLHLTFNMLALNAVGPMVEGVLGRVRYALVYFGAGLGAGAFVTLLYQLRLLPGVTAGTLFVGASGAIMGIFGATAAILLRDWALHRTPMARERLLQLAVIFGLQLLFDLSGLMRTSLHAHLGGAILGLVLGLLLQWTLARATPIARTAPHSEGMSKEG